MKKMMAIGTVVALAGGLMMSPAEASAAPVQKACGSIHAINRHLRVDVERTPRRHRLHTGCHMARGVARRYLHRSHGRNVTLDVHYRSRKYTCYKSRDDGVGWDYNCSAIRSSGHSYKNSAVGIGRR